MKELLVRRRVGPVKSKAMYKIPEYQSINYNYTNIGYNNMIKKLY
jgi:hypothetical protein